MSGETRDRTRPSGYFSPAAEEHNYLAFGGRVGLPRLLLRVAIALVLLFGVDVAISRTLVPRSQYLHAYRLPRQLPTASLADYVSALRSEVRQRRVAVRQPGEDDAQTGREVLFHLIADVAAKG